MTVFDTYQDSAVLDFLLTMLGAVPTGFLLAMFLGLLALGASKLLGLVYRLISR